MSAQTTTQTPAYHGLAALLECFAQSSGEIDHETAQYLESCAQVAAVSIGELSETLGRLAAANRYVEACFRVEDEAVNSALIEMTTLSGGLLLVLTEIMTEMGLSQRQAKTTAAKAGGKQGKTP